MDIRLTPGQQAVAAKLADVFNEQLNPSIRRLAERGHGALSDGGGASLSETAVSARELVWQTLAEVGALRLAVPSHAGGLGLGQGALATASELMGQALYQSPFFDTVTATELLLLLETGDQAAHGALLERVGNGQCRIALAAREDGAASPAAPALLAVSDDRRTVTARRRFVPFVTEVDYLLLAGTTSEGVALALVPREQDGVTVRRHDDIGRGDLYTVGLDQARVAGDGWLGAGGQVAQAYQAALTNARIRQAAYLVGLCQGALDLTVSHAKRRNQFSQPIARFQSVAFRLAALATRTEAVRHLTYLAAWEVDRGRDARLTATQSLVLAGDLAREASAEAVQLHGAFGMSDQADAQLLFRRAALDSIWLGTPTQLRAEAAEHLSTHLRTALVGHAV